MMDYILKSLRLGYRLFMENDAEAFLKHRNEKKFKYWFPGNECESVEEALAEIADYNDSINKKELPYVLAIELLETNELIGDIGISDISEIEGQEAGNIGLKKKKKYQGLGYASEALEIMSKYFSSVFMVKKLYGDVLKGNDASYRVLEKCGFEYKYTLLNPDTDPYGNGYLIFTRTE
jgi:ribosomal-protein-alanine N-acetyltransferase